MLCSAKRDQDSVPVSFVFLAVLDLSKFIADFICKYSSYKTMKNRTFYRNKYCQLHFQKLKATTIPIFTKLF